MKEPSYLSHFLFDSTKTYLVRKVSQNNEAAQCLTYCLSGQFIINSNFVTKKINRFKLSFQPQIQLQHKTQVAGPALT